MTTPTPAVLSVETIRRALGEFQLDANDQQIVYIQRYMELLLAWNEKINLTAIRDPLEILYRHFCESMYAAVAVPVENGRLADVGSGAGFPGIPLKIMRPDVQVFLIESNMKKATFLAEVLRNIELPDTKVLVSRYEELGEEAAPWITCPRERWETSNPFSPGLLRKPLQQNRLFFGSGAVIWTTRAADRLGSGKSRSPCHILCAGIYWSAPKSPKCRRNDLKQNDLSHISSPDNLPLIRIIG